VGAEFGLGELQKQVTEAKLLAAKLLIARQQSQPVRCLADAEFKVFSQFGDDGIIQYLIRALDVHPGRRIFVEFGVDDYSESNTRFLLLNDNWRGLIMDGGEENIRSVRQSDLHWRHELTAVSAFIDRDNINALIRDNGFDGEIGLLSIDIDGNDYWVWEAINVVDPLVVVVEYNSIFGARQAITIPYDPAFRRSRAHFSNLYWGCSLKALCLLADAKGYVFVGCNGAGNNAYFVRRNKAQGFPRLSVDEGFVESRFRESRDPGGRLSYLYGRQRLELIQHLPVYDLERKATMTIAKLDRS
jgi:hypothetical protein